MNSTGGHHPNPSDSLVARVDPEQDGQGLSVRNIRRRAMAFLRRFAAVGALTEEVVRDALLVTGELLSNALRHATGPYRLSMTVADRGVTIAVRDGSADLPRPARPPASGGYGLLIVERLCGNLRVLRHPDGKTVTVTIPTCVTRDGDGHG